jgi:hypothetical protein
MYVTTRLPLSTCMTHCLGLPATAADIQTSLQLCLTSRHVLVTDVNFLGTQLQA